MTGNIPGPGDFIGTPAKPARQSGAGMALIHKLPKLKARVRAIEIALADRGIPVKETRA